MKERDPSAKTGTRFIALMVVLLILVALIAVVQSISFASRSHALMAGGGLTDYSIGAGLCLIAAAMSLGIGLIAIVNLMKD